MEDYLDLTQLDTTHPITMDRFRLVLENPGAELISWVVVEGEMDAIAYTELLNGSNVMVMKAGYTAKDNLVHGGKKAVQHIVTTTLDEDLTKNVIGIVDKDYQDYEPTTPKPLPHIFYTDKRDLEMSLWSIPEVQGALVSYLFTDPQKKERCLTQSKLDKALEICRYMGAIHVSNVWHGIHRQYEFKNSHYWQRLEHKFLDDAVWQQKLFDFYCSECLRYEPVTFTQEMLKATISYFDLSNRDISEFGCGHDFLGILSSVMIDTTGYSEEKLTNYMVNACKPELFSKTQLYKQLKSWQVVHNLNLVI